VTAATFGQKPSSLLRLKDPAISGEVDRYCAVLYREWEETREVNRLKRVLHWFMGGEEEEVRPLPSQGGFEHLKTRATDEHGEIDVTRLQRRPARANRAHG
jgi:hypothetical protein